MNPKYDWRHDLSIIEKTFAAEWTGALPSLTIEDLACWERVREDCRIDEDVYALRIPGGKLLLGRECQRLWPVSAKEIDYQDILGLFHPAQAELIRWLVPKIFQILFHTIGKRDADKFRLRWLRAMRTTDGRFWYTLCDCIPFQYTEADVLYSYIGRVSYLKPYASEPLFVTFWCDGEPTPADQHRLEVLNGFLADTRAQALSKVFQLSEKRIEILQLRASGKSFGEIAEYMQVSASTTKEHCREILKRFRTTIPDMDFDRIDDVIQLLINMEVPFTFTPPKGG